jgi:hypothetical protein
VLFEHLWSVMWKGALNQSHLKKVPILILELEHLFHIMCVSARLASTWLYLTASPLSFIIDSQQNRTVPQVV